MSEMSSPALTLGTLQPYEKGFLELGTNGSLFDAEAANRGVPVEEAQTARDLKGFGASLAGITVLGLGGFNGRIRASL